MDFVRDASASQVGDLVTIVVNDIDVGPGLRRYQPLAQDQRASNITSLYGVDQLETVEPAGNVRRPGIGGNRTDLPQHDDRDHDFRARDPGDCPTERCWWRASRTSA